MKALCGWKKWKILIASSLKGERMEAQSLMLFDGLTLRTSSKFHTGSFACKVYKSIWIVSPLLCFWAWARGRFDSAVK